MVEIPMTLHDIVPLHKEPKSVDAAVKECTDLLRSVRAVNGLATLS